MTSYPYQVRWIALLLIYAQLVSCKQPTPLALTPPSLAQSSLPQNFCAAPIQDLALAPTDIQVQTVSYKTGANTLQFTLTGDYNESFYSWNICPDDTRLTTFNQLTDKTFSSRCLFAQNQTTMLHFFETNLVPIGAWTVFFAGCDSTSTCTSFTKKQVTHDPGTGALTPTQLTQQMSTQTYYQNIADEILINFKSLQAKAPSAQLSALYANLTVLSAPELAEILQTPEFQTQFPQFASLDPSQLGLSGGGNEQVGGSCDLQAVVNALQNSVDTNSQVEAMAALEAVTVTQSVTVTASNTEAAIAPSGGGGGSSTGAWVGKGFAIAGSLLAVFGSIYKWNASNRIYKFNKTQLEWLNMLYNPPADVDASADTTASKDNAQKKWGEIPKSKLAWLAPELVSIKEASLNSKNYEGVTHDSITGKTLEQVGTSIKVTRNSAFKVWGLATAGALLAFVATVVIATTVNLAGDKGTTTEEVQKLDQLAVELIHPRP